MNNELKDIISQSSFSIVPGTFVYAKVSSPPTDKHFLVTQDEDEITVVTRIEEMNSLDVIERNKESYALIALNVSVPFYSVGFLATVASAIAEKQMNILIVSTYSKDYILIKQENLDKAKAALVALGFKE